MAKPILLTVDDVADVVRGIERDLRSHYGAQYRVLASDSPEGARVTSFDDQSGILDSHEYPGCERHHDALLGEWKDTVLKPEHSRRTFISEAPLSRKHRLELRNLLA